VKPPNSISHRVKVYFFGKDMRRVVGGWSGSLSVVVYACLFLPSQELSSQNGLNQLPKTKTSWNNEADSPATSGSQSLRRSRKDAESWLNEETQDHIRESSKRLGNGSGEAGVQEQTRHAEVPQHKSTTNLSHSADFAGSGRKPDRNVQAMRYVSRKS
jgi:hypothetical protein